MLAVQGTESHAHSTTTHLCIPLLITTQCTYCSRSQASTPTHAGWRFASARGLICCSAIVLEAFHAGFFQRFETRNKMHVVCVVRSLGAYDPHYTHVLRTLVLSLGLRLRTYRILQQSYVCAGALTCKAIISHSTPRCAQTFFLFFSLLFSASQVQKLIPMTRTRARGSF
jgi:hypothetical protein